MRTLTLTALTLLALGCRTDGTAKYVSDADGDGVPSDQDCNDADASVGVAQVWYTDADGDGHGDSAHMNTSCGGEGVAADPDDCDDTDATIHPGADDPCDGIDQDCDGVVDNGAASVTVYTDADGDGYGDDATAATTCDPAPDAVTVGGDCDDADPAFHPDADESDCTDPNDYNCDGSVGYADADGDGYAACAECDDGDAAVNPAAAEVCDGVDNDCDGQTDDADDSLDPATRTTSYTDADADGYGDDATASASCVVPAGAVLTGGDCDDADPAYNPGADESDCTDPNDYNCDGSVGYADADGDGHAACAECDDHDAAVHPGASEVCDGVDNDCDGTIDIGAADATTWYADADADAWGDAATFTDSCSAPAGYVADDSDCDDADGAVSPGAVETCNGIDDDCDAQIDEGVTTTWYADADADGYGNAAVTEDTCAATAGYVADATDCDDTNAAIHPGAADVNDGIDTDCDGVIDATPWTGTGADGALDVTGTTVLGDAAVVTAIAGADVTYSGTLTLAAGDEVLLINMHGSDAAHTHVGAYAFAKVASAGAGTVMLTAAPTVTLGEVDNADLTDQAVQIVRVPQYTDVTVASGGVLTAPAWDGATGGVLAFRATGAVSVAAGGLIVVDELGYAAGQTGTSYNADAFQGESYAGSGDGNLSSGSGVYANVTYGYNLPNYGGGGALITGGGGNYGGGATDGDEWTGGTYGSTYTPAYAGETYGSADLSTLFLGSGGAGVWYGSSYPGPGGNGAGIVYIGALSLSATDAASISAIGGTTTHWATGSWTYGAGGGAGGSIWLQVSTLVLPADGLDADGGFGESTHIRAGGDGGYGRIRVDFDTLNGAPWGDAAAVAALAASTTPDAGASTTP